MTTVPPKFLIDESCDVIILQVFAPFGLEIVRVAHIIPGAPDEQVLSLAVANQQILVTEDLDFGNLIFLQQLPCYGLILIRIADDNREQKVTQLEKLFETHLQNIDGAMTVVTSDKFRIRPLKTKE